MKAATSKAPLPLIWPWETWVVVPRSARRRPEASVSPLTSCSSVLKKTFEPSLEAPAKTASKAPLPLISPWETWVVVPPERS